MTQSWHSQKAFVDGNEEGSEAAIEQKALFRADHPFVWALEARSTGTLLFVGRVDAPSA